MPLTPYNAVFTHPELTIEHELILPPADKDASKSYLPGTAPMWMLQMSSANPNVQAWIQTAIQLFITLAPIIIPLLAQPPAPKSS